MFCAQSTFVNTEFFELKLKLFNKLSNFFIRITDFFPDRINPFVMRMVDKTSNDVKKIFDKKLKLKINNRH